MGKGDRRTTNKRKPRSPVSPTYREPSGRAQRGAAQETEAQVVATAVEARQRVHGLTEKQARSRNGGDELGRLAFLGKEGGLSLTQVEALRLYGEIHEAMERAILVRKVKCGSDYERSLRGGYDSSDGTDPIYVAEYDRAMGRYRRARSAVLSTQDSFAQMSTDALVLDDKLMWDHIGAIRVTANALAHEFRDEVEARLTLAA